MGVLSLNVVLSVTALFSVAAATMNIADVACGLPVMRRSRIKGGQDAKVGEFPWLVSIRINGGHFCGGSLISSKFVLTAAHCTLRRPVKYVTVVLGEYNLLTDEKPDKEVVMEVNRIFTHENFTKRYIDDISLLELKKPVVWSKTIRPLCLADSEVDGPTDALDEKPVTIAGWGWNEEQRNGGTRTNIMQKASVKVIPRATCQSWYVKETGKPLGDPQAIELQDTHLCAGVADGSLDACQGDSGGSLMSIDSSGRQVSVGIVSAGIGCGRPKLPGIYTRVSRYLGWIQGTMRDAEHTTL